MKKNVGRVDRILRIVVGLALIAGFFLGFGGQYRWILLVGIVPLATGLMGNCALYSVLGISTCPMKR